jgi:F-type H+-transporting ATPase subunit gamma
VQSFRHIRNRIRSIQNTRKVTSAMEMISAVKLNHIDKILYACRPFISHLEGLLGKLLGAMETAPGGLFEQRKVKNNICLCLVTSDTGLCGPYNTNIIRLAEDFIKKEGRERVKLICIGKKGFNYFKSRNVGVIKTHLGLNGRYREGLSDELAADIINIFLSGQADEVYLGYMHFKNAIIYQPVLRKMLNLEISAVAKKEYIIEPNKESILERLVPEYIKLSLKLMLLEAFTSEHASRAVAMKMATDNAKELLQSLTLQMNKLRQAGITQDIMEIVSSSEALKG